MNISWKRIARSRTLQFSLALAVFGVIESQEGVFEKIIGDKYFGFFCVVISAIVAVLRVLTTTSLTDNSPK